MSNSAACQNISVDPVCGMSVEPTTAAIKSDHQGRTFYFCAEACRRAFEADPGKFAKPRKKGLWGRYMDRLQKATGGKAMKCH